MLATDWRASTVAQAWIIIIRVFTRTEQSGWPSLFQPKPALALIRLPIA